MSIGKLVVAVTGTPGVGKSLFARQLAGRVRGSTVIEINDIVKAKRLYSSRDRFGSMVVKIPALNTALNKAVRGSSGLVLVVGHLVPELRFSRRITVVLRLDLKTLIRRLRARGYPRGKINENVVSEALDYCGCGVEGTGTEVYEAESRREWKALMGYIISVYNGTRCPKPKRREIGKMGELLRLVKAGYSL